MTIKNLDYGLDLTARIKAVTDSINNIDKNIRLTVFDGYRDHQIIKSIESQLKVIAMNLLNDELKKLEKEFEEL